MLYTGGNRIQQVKSLKVLAAAIRGGWLGEGNPEELVTFFVEETRDAGKLPDWFDDRDFDLLVQFAQD